MIDTYYPLVIAIVLSLIVGAILGYHFGHTDGGKYAEQDKVLAFRLVNGLMESYVRMGALTPLLAGQVVATLRRFLAEPAKTEEPAS